MTFKRQLIPIYLPDSLFERLTALKRLFIPSKTPTPEPPPLVDLSGDREIEWAYIASRLPVGSGSVLDFGAGCGTLSMHSVQKGYQVLALDLEETPFHWSHPNLKRVRGDLLKLDLPEMSFDYIMNCSTVEHVGLTGRYGVSVEETDGDLDAMRKLHRLLKPSGKMLMTVPCGQDSVVVPWHRVYGEKRLPELLKRYQIEEQCYWMKQSDNCWHPANRESAFCYVPTSHPTKATWCSYALACFVLRVAGG
jgi:SAM-dependent methyltransferase